MKLTKEQLFAPRYKLMKDFPGNVQPIGHIYSVTGDEESIKYWCEEKDKYKDIFKKLMWWEDRTLDELPEYISYYDTSMYFPVGPYICKAEYAPFNSYNYTADFFQPATKEDYDKHINERNIKEELIQKTQFYINHNKTQLFTDNNPETQLRYGKLEPIDSSLALQEFGMKLLCTTIMNKVATVKWPADEARMTQYFKELGRTWTSDTELLPSFIESKLKVERLLLPRYQLLDAYSTYKVGTIIENPALILQRIMDKNPRIFRKLSWEQHRSDEELEGVYYKWFDKDENEEVVSHRRPHSSITPEPATKSELRAYNHIQNDKQLEDYIGTLLCT